MSNTPGALQRKATRTLTCTCCGTKLTERRNFTLSPDQMKGMSSFDAAASLNKARDEWQAVTQVDGCKRCPRPRN